MNFKKPCLFLLCIMLENFFIISRNYEYLASVQYVWNITKDQINRFSLLGKVDRKTDRTIGVTRVSCIFIGELKVPSILTCIFTIYFKSEFYSCIYWTTLKAFLSLIAYCLNVYFFKSQVNICLVIDDSLIFCERTHIWSFCYRIIKCVCITFYF